MEGRTDFVDELPDKIRHHIEEKYFYTLCGSGGIPGIPKGHVLNFCDSHVPNMAFIASNCLAFYCDSVVSSNEDWRFYKIHPLQIPGIDSELYHNDGIIMVSLTTANGVPMTLIATDDGWVEQKNNLAGRV